MRRTPERLLRLIAFVFVAAWGGVAQAAPTLLEGDLGSWLDDEVTPELSETLSRHPMFKGEPVRFVSVRNGVPQTASNELNEAIQRRLSQRLLHADGIRLALEGPTQPCDVPRAVSYVIGIEVARVGDREATLNLGIIDVAESVWVSGVSFQWRGRLSSAERRALATPVVKSRPGSAESPLQIQDADAVAAAIRQRLKCVLPRGLDGPVFLRAAEDAELTRIALALQAQLLSSPLAAITPDAERAKWTMTLDRYAAGGQLQEVRLDLQDQQGAATQRLAAVFVSGNSVPAPSTARGADPQLPTVPKPSADRLLTGLSIRPAEAVGVCDSSRARVNSCAEVEFELRETAYLLVFTSQSGSIRGLSCDARPTRSDAGLRRYRLRVPPRRVPPATNGVLSPVGDARAPDAGLYVLATTDAGVARRLQQVLRQAPATCGRDSLPLEKWLQALGNIVHQNRNDLEWRAMHLVHETEGVVQL